MRNLTGLSTEIFRKIGDIPEIEWVSVFPNTIKNYRFYKAIDESEFEGFRHYYIVIYKDGVSVGIAPCFLMDYPLDTSIEGFAKKPIARLRKAFPSVLSLKVLICGSPASEGRVGIAPKNRSKTIRALIAGMEGIARTEKAAMIAFKDVPMDYIKLLGRVLTKHGFHKIDSYPSVKMDIDFSSFEEYMKGLSHSTRKDLRRKFKKVDSLPKIDLEVCDNIDNILDDVYGLYQQTFSRSGVQFEELPKVFFANISKHMPGESKYFLWRINNKLVAFNFCLASVDTLMDEYIGLDYSFAHDYHLYFVTFRDIITWCIQNNIKKYESGALTYEPKKRLDCTFSPLSIYVKHRNNLMNFGLRTVFNFLKPENFDPVLRSMRREALS
ncbi:MAG: GNAT family N-acetyltransferase [Candidatus Omnitrophota bacterium]|jgi:predicted N-acyltransferase